LLEEHVDFWEPAVAAVVDELAALLFVVFLCVLACAAAAWIGHTLAASTASSDPTTVVLWSVARIIWLSAAPYPPVTFRLPEQRRKGIRS
jgi:hypothetical protein